MQQLGISAPPVKTENRLKALLWPSINSEEDAELIGRQGFWICAFVGTISLVVAALGGVAWAGIPDSLFFLLGGIGVRQKSMFAAVTVLLVYLLGTILLWSPAMAAGGIGRIILLSLLLANLRGTWLCAKWRAAAKEPPPIPLEGSLGERISDRLPIFLWPKVRWIYYVLAVLVISAYVAALVVPDAATDPLP